MLTTLTQPLREKKAFWDALEQELQSEIAEAVAAERERCAKLVEGNVYKEIYREWPQVGPGNSSRDSNLVKHCDALAALIRNPTQ